MYKRQAIVGTIKPNESNEYIESISFKSINDVHKIISSKKELRGIITFTTDNLEIESPLPIIRSNTLDEIIKNPSLKKSLWENIKKDLIK